MTKFQLGVLILFGFFIVAGLLTFSFYKGQGKQSGPPVVIWGTYDPAVVTKYIAKVNNNKTNISYVYKKPETFDTDFVEALAGGTAPDAVLLSQDMLFHQKKRLLPIPYTSLSQADYKNTFIPIGELYLDGSGILALPFTVDPMVMYWNKDIFLSQDIPLPPKNWEEFRTLAPTLTVRDNALNIIQSAVALGEYRNVEHAKDILSLLIMQAGNPIVLNTGNGPVSVLMDSFGKTLIPADAALTFYTEFANPTKNSYTWNRSLDNSKAMFIGNRLGVYFGYASEFGELRQRNPNLNFDVAAVPQIKAQSGKVQVKTTFGKLYGFSIVRTTADPVNVANALYFLTGKDQLATWSAATGLPSVRLDSLTADPAHSETAVFRDSALWARAWIDPNRNATEQVFQRLIESITSGKLSQQEAIINAQGEIESLLK
jgi:ABC-type glycerol-3-phosphate transport system substrate-binding protein